MSRTGGSRWLGERREKKEGEEGGGWAGDGEGMHRPGQDMFQELLELLCRVWAVGCDSLRHTLLCTDVARPHKTDLARGHMSPHTPAQAGHAGTQELDVVPCLEAQLFRAHPLAVSHGGGQAHGCGRAGGSGGVGPGP